MWLVYSSGFQSSSALVALNLTDGRQERLTQFDGVEQLRGAYHAASGSASFIAHGESPRLILGEIDTCRWYTPNVPLPASPVWVHQSPAGERLLIETVEPGMGTTIHLLERTHETLFAVLGSTQLEAPRLARRPRFLGDSGQAVCFVVDGDGPAQLALLDVRATESAPWTAAIEPLVLPIEVDMSGPIHYESASSSILLVAATSGETKKRLFRVSLTGDSVAPIGGEHQRISAVTVEPSQGHVVYAADGQLWSPEPVSKLQGQSLKRPAENTNLFFTPDGAELIVSLRCGFTSEVAVFTRADGRVSHSWTLDDAQSFYPLGLMAEVTVESHSLPSAIRSDNPEPRHLLAPMTTDMPRPVQDSSSLGFESTVAPGSDGSLNTMADPTHESVDHPVELDESTPKTAEKSKLSQVAAILRDRHSQAFQNVPTRTDNSLQEAAIELEQTEEHSIVEDMVSDASPMMDDGRPSVDPKQGVEGSMSEDSLASETVSPDESSERTNAERSSTDDSLDDDSDDVWTSAPSPIKPILGSGDHARLAVQQAQQKLAARSSVSQAPPAESSPSPAATPPRPDIDFNAWFDHVIHLPEPVASLETIAQYAGDVAVAMAATDRLKSVIRGRVNRPDSLNELIFIISVAAHVRAVGAVDEFIHLCRRALDRLTRGGDLPEVEEHFAMAALRAVQHPKGRFSTVAVFKEYESVVQGITDVLETRGEEAGGRHVRLLAKRYRVALKELVQLARSRDLTKQRPDEDQPDESVQRPKKTRTPRENPKVDLMEGYEFPDEPLETTTAQDPVAFVDKFQPFAASFSLLNSTPDPSLSTADVSVFDPFEVVTDDVFDDRPWSAASDSSDTVSSVLGVLAVIGALALMILGANLSAIHAVVGVLWMVGGVGLISGRRVGAWLGATSFLAVGVTLLYSGLVMELPSWLLPDGLTAGGLAIAVMSALLFYRLIASNHPPSMGD